MVKLPRTMRGGHGGGQNVCTYMQVPCMHVCMWLQVHVQYWSVDLMGASVAFFIFN